MKVWRRNDARSEGLIDRHFLLLLMIMMMRRMTMIIVMMTMIIRMMTMKTVMKNMMMEMMTMMIMMVIEEECLYLLYDLLSFFCFVLLCPLIRLK